MTKTGRTRRMMKRAPIIAVPSPPKAETLAPTTAVAAPAPLAPAIPRARTIRATDPRACAVCGALSAGPGGRLLPAGWVCTWCCRWTTSEDNIDAIVEFGIAELVGLRSGTRKLGCADLIELAPPNGSGDSRRWAHVDVDDLRRRFRERFGANSIPLSESERMRAAIAAKRARGESRERVRAAKVMRLEKRAARTAAELRKVQGERTAS